MTAPDAGLIADCKALIDLEWRVNYSDLDETDEPAWQAIVDELRVVRGQVETTPATTRAGMAWKARAALAMVHRNADGEVVSTDANQILVDQVLDAVAAEAG